MTEQKEEENGAKKDRHQRTDLIETVEEDAIERAGRLDSDIKLKKSNED